MFAQGLRDLCTSVTSAAKRMNATSGKGITSKSDPSTVVIIFMAFLCAVLPLDISQLAFAILGAVLYSLLQKSDQHAPKKQRMSAVVHTPPPKPKPGFTRPVSVPAAHAKPVAAPSPSHEVRAPSVQPIVAPTFQSGGWEGDIQELLLEITPTVEAEQIVNRLARLVSQTMRSMIPEIEVNGFANGNLTSGKAFGVAVPEVDIVASVSPHILFGRVHGCNTQGGASQSQLDPKKLQKTAIRTCCDRLVSAAGFKFRRSAFRGQEPKVTLLVPASLGLFSESIPIDFSVNVVTPLYNAALLTECGKIDSRAKELVLIVKRWAKDRGICHAAKGHLSPYMWGLLTIYFLQVRDGDEGSLLPPLEQFEMSSRLLKGKTAVRDTTQQPSWKPAHAAGPKKSVGALFKEFVHFFTTQFDWHKEAVSICAGRRAPPSLDLPLHIIVSGSSNASQVGPSIEDPFHAAQNLGDGMTAVSLARLTEELSRAEAICLRDASLSELLQPWVPAEAAETQDQGERGECNEDVPPAALAYKASQATNARPSLASDKTLGKRVDWRRDAMEVQATAAARQSTPPWRRSAAPAPTR